MALLLNAGDTVSRSYSYTQPSPLHPSQPQGTGEKTGNLYNINAHDVNNGYVNDAQLSQDGTTETWGSAEISEYIPINGDTAYTFNGIGSYNSPCYALYDENKQLIGAYKYSGRNTINFISPNNARYFRFTHIKAATQAMTVEGTYISSTMPEFEPYGYKIPISSANTTTSVYLGEVETTRRIGKYEFTGQESFYRDKEREGSWRFYTAELISAIGVTAICSHFENIGANGVNNSDNIGFCIFYRAQFGCRFSKSIAGTVNEFKAWLAQQYANGTPVTVWYVLATETTGIVNEPLMRIGKYADTVSGITIPTVTGADSFDVLTALKPSEASLNYTGWHDATVQEWDGSQWNE